MPIRVVGDLVNKLQKAKHYFIAIKEGEAQYAKALAAVASTELTVDL